ncbi:hypothetical protein [Chromobacterium violaceum]|uniref:Uncharacterized protein n=1 Tax=Chromobacterium violaceum TaxID=536 RepID=A0AAX2MH81_CHRVL|nr:hypothetical protein [Chromobacterium violaceum]OLZ80635.1 hypothetical protein BS642_09765 [Chromobacterium violaceum]QIY78872.1 hypothetical protein FOB43_06545 [Chromobacterium violaceum]STB69403.1 Uncharacterised protein [Chromobacterium violaceum]SUY93332.1 Uncharacterised protein [Chromobacterium violaceum]
MHNELNNLHAHVSQLLGQHLSDWAGELMSGAAVRDDNRRLAELRALLAARDALASLQDGEQDAHHG